jgi:hypothetical protein
LYTDIDSPDSLTSDIYVQMHGDLRPSNVILLKNREPLKSGSARIFTFNFQNNNIGRIETIEISVSNMELDSYNWHLHKVSIESI